MSRMPDPNVPLIYDPPPKRTPQQVASTVGMYVKAFVTIVGWGVVATAGIAAGWVCLRVILWAVQISTEALGIQGEVTS